MKPIFIPLSLGDVMYFADVLWCVLRHRRLRCMRNGWYSYREGIRRGLWKPWTVGDLILLHRKKKHLAHWPRIAPWPAPWRHRDGVQ